MKDPLPLDAGPGTSPRHSATALFVADLQLALSSGSRNVSGGGHFSSRTSPEVSDDLSAVFVLPLVVCSRSTDAIQLCNLQRLTLLLGDQSLDPLNWRRK